MATRLKQIISVVALAGGATQVFPHALNWNGRPVVPDHAEPNDDDLNGDLEVTAATTTTISIRNNGAGAVTAFFLLESWHTIERDFGAAQTVALTPQPFVPTRGGVGGIDVEDEGVPLAGNPHTIFNFVGAGVTAVDAGAGEATITIPGGGMNAAMFYGMTTGTGNAGPNDYAATVAVQTVAGTGIVPFPRNGPTVGAPATRNGADVGEFILPAAGVYEVSWEVGIVEASQLQLALNDVGIPTTTVTSGAGTQVNQNTVLIEANADDVLSLINPPGNAAALTIQPADGNLTHAQAPSLVIKFIG